MPNLREYLWAESPQQALRLLHERPGRGSFVAGGTGLASEPSGDLEFVVDVSRLGLDAIAPAEPGLRLGAAVTLQALVDSTLIIPWADGILHEAVSQTRTEPWRRQATLAGRVLEGQPGDLVLPVLLVLGARVRLVERSDASPVEKPLEQAVRDRGGLWLDIRLPQPEPTTGHALETLARSALDAPLAAVAASLRLSSGSIASSRVATSALPSPRRAPGVEAALAGRGPDGRAFAAAQAALANDIAPADDHRASAEYRARIAPILLARALRRAGAAAQGRSRAARS